MQAAGAETPPHPVPQYAPDDLLEDKYQLVRQIGSGGMGTVWIARNVSLDIHVAVKLLRADVTSVGAASRLLLEARAAASLGHPAIVRVLDFGKTHRNDPFLVMELLDGEGLLEVLTRHGRMSANLAVQTLLPVADALVIAHGKGIVHRDLKTENIFLQRTESGAVQPKVLDFGLARLANDPHHRLTQFGTVMGSPAFMAPEQACGSDEVDHRADIWSFSVVLYELVTGLTPFRANNYNALLRTIVHEEPRPTVAQAAGDDALWRIIERGLRKDRDRRWQSMQDVRAALAQWLVDRGVNADIAGAALRTSWLRADILSPPTSEPPPEPNRSESITGEPLLSNSSLRPVAGDRTTLPERSTSPTDRRRAAPERMVLALGVLAIAVGSVAVGWGLRSRYPYESSPTLPTRHGSVRTSVEGLAPRASAPEPVREQGPKDAGIADGRSETGTVVPKTVPKRTPKRAAPQKQSPYMPSGL